MRSQTYSNLMKTYGKTKPFDFVLSLLIMFFFSTSVFPLYRLSFMLFGATTFIVTVLVGLIASLVTGKPAAYKNHKYARPMAAENCRFILLFYIN